MVEARGIIEGNFRKREVVEDLAVIVGGDGVMGKEGSIFLVEVGSDSGGGGEGGAIGGHDGDEAGVSFVEAGGNGCGGEEGGMGGGGGAGDGDAGGIGDSMGARSKEGCEGVRGTDNEGGEEVGVVCAEEGGKTVCQARGVVDGEAGEVEECRWQGGVGRGGQWGEPRGRGEGEERVDDGGGG